MNADTTHDVTPAQSAANEAYRILRSTLKFASGATQVRSVLVVDIDRTSPSGVAQQLARSFARAGDRCVLIETDTRHGQREPGFSDMLAGTAIDGLVHPADGAGPAIVHAGSIVDPDLLAGAGCAQTIESLLADNDFAILSAASLPTHGDALSLAPRADAVVLVVTVGRTRRPRAVEARDALDRVGARMLGVVMLEGKRSLFW